LNNIFNQNKLKHIFSAFCLIILTGCATFTPVKNEVRPYKSYGFEAKLPQDWMKFNQTRTFLLTKDGISLNYIQINRARLKEKLEFTKKIFTADMLPSDLAEVEIDNLKSDTAISNVTVMENKPMSLSGKDCYFIHYTYQAGNKLTVEGMQYGFLHDNKWVYRIRFEAPKQHYFKTLKPDFDEVILSFKVL
jgi:hypothetical protein